MRSVPASPAFSLVLSVHPHRVPSTAHLSPPRDPALADTPSRALYSLLAGLVGQAIKYTIENEPVGSRFGGFAEDDIWVYASSKDGDLKSVHPLTHLSTRTGRSCGRIEVRKESA